LYQVLAKDVLSEDMIGTKKKLVNPTEDCPKKSIKFWPKGEKYRGSLLRIPQLRTFPQLATFHNFSRRLKFFFTPRHTIKTNRNRNLYSRSVLVSTSPFQSGIHGLIPRPYEGWEAGLKRKKKGQKQNFFSFFLVPKVYVKAWSSHTPWADFNVRGAQL